MLDWREDILDCSIKKGDVILENAFIKFETFFSAISNFAPKFITGLGHDWVGLEVWGVDCLDTRILLGSAKSIAVAGTVLAIAKEPPILDENTDTTTALLIPETIDDTSAATRGF